jgi:tripartite ATP-independent transporter DctP family solute receptor
MKTKAIKLILVMVAFVLLVSAGGYDRGGAAGTITIKAGHGLPETTSLGLGFLKFKELVEAKSGGSIIVEIYPNGQLGGDRELTESAQLGNVTMTAVSATNLSIFAKEFYALDTFFMFDTRNHVYRVLDGKAGSAMLAALSEKNLAGLGYWENGFRYLTNSKRPVNGPSDMTGIKMRVPENPIQIAAWNSVGAGPTPMAWGELFTALQQRVLDGQECSMENVEAMKFYEVQQYVSLTGHTYTPYVVIMNNDFYKKLSADSRKIIDEALKETTIYQRKVAAELEQKSLETVRKAGNVISEITPQAKAEFRRLMAASQAMVKERAGAAMYDLFSAEVERLRN